MATITIHSILMNAAAKLPNGKERRLLDQVADLMDYRIPENSILREAGARIINFEEDDSATQIGAICPNCKREPVQIQANPVQFGPVPALMFTCSQCRKVISVAIVPPPPMVPQMEERQSSGIIIPH